MTEAVVGSRSGALAAAVDEGFAEAARMLEHLAAATPDDLRLRSYLGAVASNHAQVILIRRGDPGTAADLLQRAVAAQRAALAGAPSARAYRSFLESHLLLLAQACFRGGDFAGARGALTEAQSVLRDGSEHLITVAVGLLLCAEHGQPDAVDAALAVLQRAAAGKDRAALAALADDPRLAALHGDPRFVALLARARSGG
jgi:hypothetical protein